MSIYSIFIFQAEDVIRDGHVTGVQTCALPISAPALIIVGVLMSSSLKDIEWDKFEIAVPAFLTIIMMPLSYSIATGIAVGFIFYPITMIMKGRIKEIHPVMYALFFIFILYFIFLS